MVMAVDLTVLKLDCDEMKRAWEVKKSVNLSGEELQGIEEEPGFALEKQDKWDDPRRQMVSQMAFYAFPFPFLFKIFIERVNIFIQYLNHDPGIIPHLVKICDMGIVLFEVT